MQDNVITQALSTYAKNNATFTDLMTHVNRLGVNTAEARKVAGVVGDVFVSKGAGEQQIIGAMGKAYEAVVYHTAVSTGAMGQAPAQYHNPIVNEYNKLVAFLNGLQQDTGRTAGAGTSIFTAQPKTQQSLFGGGEAPQSSLFSAAPKTESTSLFSGAAESKDTSPFGASPAQEQVSMFEQPVTTEQATEIVKQTQSTKELSMEELILHETEQTLRGACVSTRRVSEDIAKYKALEITEDQLKVLEGSNDEFKLDVGSRTALNMVVRSNVREFYFADEATARAKEKLADAITVFTQRAVDLNKLDFTQRMVFETTKVIRNLVTEFSEYTAAAKAEESLDVLTLTEVTRANNALVTELYRALGNAISFATEGDGFPNVDGGPNVFFDLDYSDFLGELQQLEDFYASYNGAQSSIFELLYTYLAKALSWIRLTIDDDRITVGVREIHAEVSFPLLDGIETTSYHQLIDREAAGENLDLLTAIVDMVESRLPAARLHVTDGLYRTNYVDRSYSTGRLKTCRR